MNRHQPISLNSSSPPSSFRAATPSKGEDFPSSSGKGRDFQGSSGKRNDIQSPSGEGEGIQSPLLKGIGGFLFRTLLVLLTFTGGCANTPNAQDLERTFAADPKLTSPNSSPSPSQSPLNLPEGFPKEIPLYPQARLKSSTFQNAKQITRWESGDPSNLIQSFYGRELRSKNWQINSTATNDTTLVASRDTLQLQLTIKPQTASGTEFTLEYGQITSSPSPSTTPSANSSPAPSPTSSPTQGFSVNPSPTSGDSNIPAPMRSAVEEVLALGVITSDASGTKISLGQLEPNKIITRREYARWLVAANNRIYNNQPGQQVRLATNTDQPAFSDIAGKDPDFGAIQGLAEAGLIPSRLSGDQAIATFNPDAPVTREQLILWKIPLDTRQALPTTSIEAVQQTWGFQDASRIDPLALRAVATDFQNGSLANIRRVFGFTTLFQPQRPVSRAEAITTLWYFGSQGRGISAKDTQQILLRSP